MNIPHLFPPLPGLKVTGAPMMLEPILGSGERITVAVAVVGSDGEVQVVQILRSDAAKCLVGDQAEVLLGFAKLGVDSLHRHLTEGGTLRSWRPPTTGLSLGEVREGWANDLSSSARSIARDHDLLSSLADFPAQAEGFDDVQPDRWLSQIRAAVSAQRPGLSSGFSKKLRMTDGGAETTIDFLGATLAAQTGRLVPGQSLSRLVGSAKTKLWDLDTLRTWSRTHDLAGERQTRHELILFRPRDKDLLDSSDRERDRLHQALTTLESAGDQHQIRVRPVSSAEEAASIIIQAEAA